LRVGNIWLSPSAPHAWLTCEKTRAIFYPIFAEIEFVEVQPKLIVTRSHTFSRASSQQHVITSSFDWLIGLSVSFVIG